ncbi:MAG: xanthine dehydrogenase family protein subunit M, partial [Deltaproteobacteria bacterium]
MSNFQYHRPTSLAEAFRIRTEQPDARFVAGGTDVLPHVHDRTYRPAALISLRRVRELDGVDVGADGVTRIGGLTRVADLTSHAALEARLPTLVQAARRLGSVQIRNVATVGGNLCNASPCADLAPPLLAYDARVRIEGPGGAREVPLEDFFLGNRKTRLEPTEVLVAIVIDAPPAGTASRFDKIVRVRMDIALTSAAVLLRVESGRVVHARVAMGSVAPRPVRLGAVETFLVGRAPGEDTAREAGVLATRSVTPIDDVRATAAY